MARAGAIAEQPAAGSRPAAGERGRSGRRKIEEDVLLTAVLCLLALGAVMVYSASSATSVVESGGTGSSLLVRYVVFGSLGFAALLVVSRMSLQRIMELTGPILAASFILLLAVKIPGLGVSVNGAQRWLGAGFLQFQPSEIAKVAVVLYCARFLAEKPNGFRTMGELLPLGIVVGATALLVVTQPDLGTTLVLCATVGAMLVIAAVPMRWLAGLTAIGSVLVLLFSLSASYRRDRLMSFMNPWDHAGDAGFQAVQGQIAIGSGGLFGRGLGESVQKIFYLPEAHTDFILAIIGEELGVIGLFGLLVLFALVAWAGLRIAQQADGLYATLVAGGVTSLILCQAILNVFTVLGLAPLTGVPLPFISYGSTSLVTLLVGVGLLLNVARGGTVRVREAPPARRRSRNRPPDAGRSTVDEQFDDFERIEVFDRRGRDRRARGAGAGGRRRASH
ncbi:MAG: putative lipid II flippase FtsW [Solirubrobacterales bacterium]